MMGSRPQLRLAVVGDSLLDREVRGTACRLTPDAPVPVVDVDEEWARPGGAGLAALLAARDGHRVRLVTGLADDPEARRLRCLLDAEVEVVALPFAGRTPVKERVRAAGQTLLRLDRGGLGGPRGAAGDGPVDRLDELLAGCDAVLVADYGGGLTALPAVRTALRAAAARHPVVWDPHPRGEAPVSGVQVVTPNAAEARQFRDRLDRPAAAPGAILGRGTADLRAAAEDAAALVRHWSVGAVAVTLGPGGALLSYGDGPPSVLPGRPVPAADTCGAGDQFAATVTAELGAGAVLPEAVASGVREAATFVACGAAAALRVPAAAASGAASSGAASSGAASSGAAGDPSTVDELVRTVRRAGGTVVATGGCFDVLHAGHVSVLTAARALGDCLVVCINSDDSVRRLKGGDRPVTVAEDRQRVLRALECVDAVVVFDEDTPEALLRRLRPHIWAKGGDYAHADLPEAAVLREWGGQAVLLPYLAGRSTSRLLARTTAGPPAP